MEASTEPTSAGPISRWSRLQLAGVVLAVAAAVYAPTATWNNVQITDTKAAAIAAWQLGEHGSWALPSNWQDIPWRSVTPGGESVTNRFPGAIVWGAAFYAITPGSGEPQRAHDAPFGPATAAAVTASALAVAVMFLVLDGVVRRRVALGACVLLAFGTGMWTVSADSLFTHGPSQLALALGLLALRHDRLWLAGLALGAAMTARPQLGVVALVVGLGLLVTRRSLVPTIKIGVTSAVGLAALVAHARALFGRWVPVAGYDASARLDFGGNAARTGDSLGLPLIVEDVAWTLVHPHRGVLLYSSFLVVLIPGLRAGWRAAGDWARVAAIAGVVGLLVQLLSNPGVFHGGDDFFGYRLPLEMITLSTPVLALAAQEWVLPRRLMRQALAVTSLGALVLFAAGTTFADPRNPNKADYQLFLDNLGPNGEGYEHGGAVGYDASEP